MPRKKKPTHWTQLPENKERVHQLRLKGVKTLAKRRAERVAGKIKDTVKNNKTKAQRAADAAWHRERRVAARAEAQAMRMRDAQVQLDREIVHRAIETHGSNLPPGKYEVPNAQTQQAYAVAYTHVSTWIGLYAEVNGISESALAKWVAETILRKANR